MYSLVLNNFPNIVIFGGNSAYRESGRLRAGTWARRPDAATLPLSGSLLSLGKGPILLRSYTTLAKGLNVNLLP